MLEAYPELTANEQEVFSFIPANSFLIEELSKVMECIKTIESICKHRGLSRQTVSECVQDIEKHLLLGNPRMFKLGSNIIIFLQKEAALLESDEAVHNNSSDILESFFGIYKARKSPNKLYGVTSFILFVPIYTRLIKESQAKTFDFKAAVEDIRFCDIEDWGSKNLSPNLVTMRTKCLQKTG